MVDHMILGIDWLSANGVILDYVSKTLSFQMKDLILAQPQQ